MVSGSIVSPSLESNNNNPARMISWIQGLESEETLEDSLDLLSKNRHTFHNLAIWLWYSFGTIGILIRVIISAYRPLLSESLSERVIKQTCNAIALLQTVASHPDTRMEFIKATMPVYLYPFLNTMKTERNYECLRLTSLGVIGSLAKVNEPEVVDYLLSTQIFPSCLRCMEFGSTLSKTVATLIIYRILRTEQGVKYCFVLGERYLSVSQCLGKMVENLNEEEEENLPHLLRNIIGCYLRLSENQRTRAHLVSYVPSKLIDYTYINVIRDDTEALGNLRQLILNLKTNSNSATTQSNGESPGSKHPMMSRAV